MHPPCVNSGWVYENVEALIEKNSSRVTFMCGNYRAFQLTGWVLQHRYYHDVRNQALMFLRRWDITDVTVLPFCILFVVLGIRRHLVLLKG